MTDMVRPDVFSRFPVFAGLEADTRADLARLGSSHRWAAGQMIFQRGDSDDRMIAVLSGRIRLSLMTPQGRELVLTSVGPGEVLGELALLDGEPRSTDAMATEVTTAILLTRERFMQVARQRADLPLAIARHVCGHLRRATFQMESIALYDLQGRLVRYLLMAAHQAKGGRDGTEIRVDLGLNQSDLAAVLGATRSRVNNALQDLVAEGAIRRDGAAVICNIPKLRALSDDLGDVGP